jgi:hypothetical protein
MKKQRTLFDAELEYDIEVKKHARRTDPENSKVSAKEIAETGRAKKQCAMILDMLQDGPVNSAMLSAVSLKYTARISDLRQHGHVVQATRHNGVWWYSLITEEQK